nr:MAG TPA: INTERNALIN B BINDING, LEUCINE RICH REPEAT.2A [Caudoviricetes sp.]
MKSSIANKSMLAVAVLLVAAFAGVAFVGTEDSDAAVSYTVSVDGADKKWEDTEYALFQAGYKDISKDTGVTNALLGNDLKVVDGKITGTVVKVKDEDLVYKLWYEWKDSSGEIAKNKAKLESYIFVINFSGLTPDSYINFEPSVKADETYAIKSIQADSKGNAALTFKSFEGSKAIDKFEFVLSAKNLSTSAEGADIKTLKEAFESYNKQVVEFDIEFIGSPVTVEYTVGDLIYIQKSNQGKTYKLVSLDDLRAVAPEGKRFVGWVDEKNNTYPVGTVFVLGAGEGAQTLKFSAVFEDIPAVMITFKDGTSTLKVVNVTELSESTIPTVSKVGYNFDGWFHDGAKVDPLTYAFTESVTLEAKWTAINCYVTFVAGADYSKTVPVLYGSTVQAPVVPSGYTGWDFDFAQAITEDVTIEAIAAPAPEPSGFDDPVFLTMVMVGVVIVLALLAAFIYAIKEGKIVIGRGPNSKNGKGGNE